jgi:hypothetical protein
MVGGNFASTIILQLVDVAYNLALLSAKAVKRRRFCRFLLLLNGEGSMMIFSNSSVSSIGRSADGRALMVIETSSGSVHSGRAAAIIYSNH